jgi:hypothetical protein
MRGLITVKRRDFEKNKVAKTVVGFSERMANKINAKHVNAKNKSEKMKLGIPEKQTMIFAFGDKCSNLSLLQRQGAEDNKFGM